eukprot:2204428-Amphidinium_carterae.1
MHGNKSPLRLSERAAVESWVNRFDQQCLGRQCVQLAEVPRVGDYRASFDKADPSHSGAPLQERCGCA